MMQSVYQHRNWLERTLHKIGVLITGYLSTFLGTIGSALIVVSATVASDSHVIGFLLSGIACTVLGVATPFFVKPSYPELRKKCDELEASCEEQKRSLATMLGYLAKRCLESAVKTDSAKSRISVYVERSGSFAILSRWSRSENLRKLGRRSFPCDQGLIGDVWNGRKGAASAQRLPADKGEWIRYQCERLSLDEATAQRLTMHSRSLCGVRVDAGRKSIVVVIESLEPTLLNLSETEALKENYHFQDLALAISELTENAPALGSDITDAPDLSAP